MKKLTTLEILRIIDENGGFDNFNNWAEKEVAEWVYANFNCSRYVAKNVATYL